MDGFVIRAAIDSDLPALTALYIHYVQHTAITVDTDPSPVTLRRGWFSNYVHHGPPESMRLRKITMLKEEQDPRSLGQGAIFDTYRYVGGRAKAYDTWLKAQEAKQQLSSLESPAPDAAKKGGKRKQAAPKE